MATNHQTHPHPTGTGSLFQLICKSYAQWSLISTELHCSQTGSFGKMGGKLFLTSTELHCSQTSNPNLRKRHYEPQRARDSVKFERLELAKIIIDGNS